MVSEKAHFTDDDRRQNKANMKPLCTVYVEMYKLWTEQFETIP